jgi:hypothetical protein
VKEHLITVDVHAHWGVTPPRYRIYVNDHLLTERDFVWAGHEIYIRENISVRLNPGTHKLRVEQIGDSGKIIVKNVTVDGIPSTVDFITT